MTLSSTKLSRTVELHVLIKRIGTIDVLKELFEAEIQIESQWVEIDPFTVYDPKKMWNPQLFIPNAISVAKEDTKHSVLTENSGRKFITELKTIKGNYTKNGFDLS